MIKKYGDLNKSQLSFGLYVPLMFIFLLFYGVEALKVTIDADGAASYKSLDEFFAVLDGMDASSIPDSVVFIGSNPHVYNTTRDFKDTYKGTKKMSFLSTATNPDSFPVLNLGSLEFYYLFKKSSTSFERLIVTKTGPFIHGQSDRDLSFSQCVIRNCKSYFLKMEGEANQIFSFSNCLFINNDSLFFIHIYGLGKPHMEITNCTFDNNNVIFSNVMFDNGDVNGNNMYLKNNIFSNNRSIFPSNLLKLKSTNSLTSESTTGYGTGCKQIVAADTAALYKFTSRTKETIPSHWKLGSTSVAKGFLGSNISLPVDIAGTARLAPFDAGCWKFDNVISITTQPKNNTVGVNANVIFKVVASSAFNMTYAWYRKGSDVPVSQADSCLVVASLALDSTRYWCIVSSTESFITSDTVTLRVVNKPVISTQPANSSVYQGQNATFTVVATHPLPIMYTWFKTDSNETVKTKISGAVTSTLTLDKVTDSYDGAVFYCMVSVFGDSTKSNLAFLKVKKLEVPVITDQTNSLQTGIGNSASLFVTVSGMEYTVQWYKDDLPIPSSVTTVYQILSTNLSDNGTYHCEVTNKSGTIRSKDIKVTINDQNRAYNPIVLKGKFINRSSIRLTVKNFMNLPVQNDTVSYVDTVGIWYKNSNFPITPDKNDINLLKFPLNVLRAMGGDDSLDTLITIPVGNQECDSICFIATPFWHMKSQQKDSLPPFITNLGCKVYSCGSDLITNPLSLEISMLKPGVVTSNIDGFNGLNKNNISYIVTYYGKVGSYLYDTIKTTDFPAIGSFKKDYTNVLFAQQTDTIYFGVYIRGIDGNYSNTVVKKFIPKYLLPNNDATLQIDTVMATQIALKWILPTSAENIRIWYGLNPIPVSADSQFSSPNHKSVLVPAMPETILVSGLVADQRYFFGLELQRDGIWSGISKSAQCEALTSKINPEKVVNTINITNAEFDTLTNKFTIKFTFDSTKTEKSSFEVGYTINKTGFDGPKGVVAGIKPILKLTPVNDTNNYIIALGNDLDFDTSYYVSLWARFVNGAWSEPTDSSRKKLTVPSLKWMEIALFNENSDSLTTFEKRVLFWKTPAWQNDPWKQTTITDTLDMYKLSPEKIPAGFIPVSIGTRFRNPDALKTPELHFGIRINSLPPEYTPKDVNMYVYDTVTAKFKVIYKRDLLSNDNVVSVLLRPSEYSSPLMLFIDTQKPVVNILDDTASAITAGEDLIYNIQFKDNISNVITTFKCGIGSDVFTSVVNDTVSDKVYQFRVPLSVINANSGVRAMLIVRDGRFLDTIDLSRNVFNTLVLKTEEMKWFPLCVHYELNSVKVDQLFDSLSGPEKKYDNTKFRLFKWYDSTTYKTEMNKYVEYDKVMENDSLFDLKPGNLIWLKTRKATTLNFGNVKTLSLKKEYTIKLPPNTWTDIALPFDFPVKIYDILQATRLNSDKNKLVINKWQKDSTKKDVYTISTSIHDPTRGDGAHPELDLSGNDVYTIYYDTDNLTDTINLIFPPVSSAMSGYIPSVAKRSAYGWSVTINATAEKENLNAVYCGFTTGGQKKTLIPVAPSFGSIKMGVVENGKLYGRAIAHEKSDGYAYNLRFENTNVDKQTIRCSVEKTVTSGMNMKLFNSITGTTEDVTAGFTVEVDGQSSGQRWLLVGGAAFIGNFVQVNKSSEFSLLKIFPNPFRGTLHIKYMIPSEGINSVNCALFDPLGKQVWDFKIDKELHPGLNYFVWQPGQGALKKLASGTYFLKLVAKDFKGKITGSKLAKVMYFTN